MAPLLPGVMATRRASDGSAVGTLALTGAVLLVLAGASYGLSFVALGAFALPLALAIAACKGLTVLLAFMEFGKLPASAKLAAGAALLMLFLLLGLMVADVATRERAPLAAPRPSRARAASALRFEPEAGDLEWNPHRGQQPR